MIKSMTGFGRGDSSSNTKEIAIEIKSVNHRYADFSIRVPRYYNFLEEKIREYLQKYVSRGKVDVYLSIESREDEEKFVSINSKLAKSYIDALRQLRDDFNLKDDISVLNIAGFNDILKLEKKEEDQDALWELVKDALDLGVREFIGMREREGLRLSQDLIERTEKIEGFLGEIDERSPEVVEDYREKISQRIQDYLKEFPIDENRILTEVAIFSDKVNITEEIVRLKSHLEELREILKSDEPVGRKLDFLIQEMNREVNTIGSKANDIYISKRVVDIKAEIEKFREQIQNIE